MPAILASSIFIGGSPCSGSEAFHRDRYRERTWAWDRLRETSDPEQAYENWMRRDALLAAHILAEARAHGFWVREVDHATDFERLYAELRDRFTAASAGDQLSSSPEGS